MAKITAKKQKVRKQNDFIILPLKEYNKLIIEIYQNKLRKSGSAILKH